MFLLLFFHGDDGILALLLLTDEDGGKAIEDGLGHELDKGLGGGLGGNVGLGRDCGRGLVATKEEAEGRQGVQLYSSNGRGCPPCVTVW